MLSLQNFFIIAKTEIIDYYYTPTTDIMRYNLYKITLADVKKSSESKETELFLFKALLIPKNLAS